MEDSRKLHSSLMEKKKVNPWWDDDGDGIGYEPGEVGGKFKRKKKGKKKVEEGFSNWREELFEVVEKSKDNQKVKEMPSGKSNKITINPEIKESIETMGGTLLEVFEINELEYVAESVYSQLLDEGYYEDDIVEALDYALDEARVTYGHDTEKPYEKKTGIRQTIKAVGRLARKKLKDKARDFVVSGARKVAAKASKLADKYEKTPSGRYRNAGAGKTERASSGSYEGPSSSSSRTSPEKRRSVSNDIRARAATRRAGRRNVKRKLDDLLASIRNEDYDLYEREMTSSDKAKEGRLKKKFDASSMKQNMMNQYGKEKGKQVYFAKIRKMAMEDYDPLDEAKLSRTEKRAKSAGKKSGKSKTMHLVDLDDNAMKEKKHGEGAKIEVKKSGKTDRDKKSDDEDYDFKQFKSSKVFKKTLKGNKHVRNLHRGGEASGLTARGEMDNNREVKSHVKASGFSKKHGVNFKRIHFTGDVPGKSTDDKKMKVIKNLIKSKKPKSIKFSDDQPKNLQAPERFNREEGKDKNKNRGSSTPKIKTYLTRSDGKPKRFGSGGGGIRNPEAVNKSSSTQETQRRRAKARRGMSEGVVETTPENKDSKKASKDKLKLLLLRQKELEYEKRMLRAPGR